MQTDPENLFSSNPVFIRIINSLENRKEAYIISNMAHCKAISETIAILTAEFYTKIDENLDRQPYRWADINSYSANWSTLSAAKL